MIHRALTLGAAGAAIIAVLVGWRVGVVVGGIVWGVAALAIVVGGWLHNRQRRDVEHTLGTELPTLVTLIAAIATVVALIGLVGIGVYGWLGANAEIHPSGAPYTATVPDGWKLAGDRAAEAAGATVNLTLPALVNGPDRQQVVIGTLSTGELSLARFAERAFLMNLLSQGASNTLTFTQSDKKGIAIASVRTGKIARTPRALKDGVQYGWLFPSSAGRMVAVFCSGPRAAQKDLKSACDQIISVLTIERSEQGLPDASAVRSAALAPLASALGISLPSDTMADIVVAQMALAAEIGTNAQPQSAAEYARAVNRNLASSGLRVSALGAQPTDGLISGSMAPRAGRLVVGGVGVWTNGKARIVVVRRAPDAFAYTVARDGRRVTTLG